MSFGQFVLLFSSARQFKYVGIRVWKPRGRKESSTQQIHVSCPSRF